MKAFGTLHSMSQDWQVWKITNRTFECASFSKHLKNKWYTKWQCAIQEFGYSTERLLYPCNLISCWHQFLLQWPYESRDTENVPKSTKSNGTWTFEPTETLHTFPRGVCEKNESSLKCISTTISKILYRFLKSEAIDHEDKQHGQNMQSMVSRASWFIMAWTYALGQMYFTWGALISSKPALQPSLTGRKKS